MSNLKDKNVLNLGSFAKVHEARLENKVNLRRIEEIPSKYRHFFGNYPQFNSVQSKVFDDVFHTTKSIIVSAPTGSGKTVIFELAMIQLLMATETNVKIVYVAPIKALCSEKYCEWSKKFHPLGISCREVTGDSDITDFNELSFINLIITTPEKWDSLTRKWKDNEDFVSTIRLFLIDEVHLLNEDRRGPILETIVSRMKTIQFSLKVRKKNEINLRFIAASATIPNIEDLALWIGGKEDRISYFRFSEDQRPVKLEKYILGFNLNASGFKFDMSLNYKLLGIIRKYSAGKPTLIFCSSRKSVEMASAVLLQNSPVTPLSDNHKAALVNLSRKLQNSKLQSLALKAIAFHHAGLSHDDRNLIEDAFRRSLVLILVCTNTLAMGVNLPAHLVIIKSTETFVRGTVIEYSQSSILQMIGRAGRPQYDIKGVAVIMTQQKNVKKYENLMNGCTPVESHLHKHLAEHLNSEIVLQTITDLEVAMEWIRSTFLYVRAIKCPVSYGFSLGLTREKVEKKLEEMCLIQINSLETHGLITKDQAFGLSVAATQYGRLMARYYISFDTMKTFRKFRGDESLCDIFNLVISSKEFSEFTIRVNDKKTLNALNTQSIRFPIKGKVKSVENKVSCLIQAVLGNVTIQEPSLVQDSFKMTRQGERIAKCLVEYIRLSENRLNRSIFKALLNAVILSKCLKANLWEDSEYVCKQLKKIGAVYSNLLVSAGKTSLQSLIETDARTLEMILNKPPPFGNEIHEGLIAFPEYILQMRLTAPGLGTVVVKQTKETYQYDGKNSTLIIGDTNNNLILLNDKVDFIINANGNFERDFKIPDCLAQSILAHLVHECLVGVDRQTSLTLNPLDDFECTKKPKRKVQTKLKAPRSVNKLRKISASEKKSTSTSNPASDSYVALLEDDEYFRDLEMSNEIIHSKGDEQMDKIERKGKISQKLQIVNETIKRKLNNFEYAEKPKMNKCPIEEESLVNIFDDDFEDSIKEFEFFEEVNKIRSEIPNSDNCSSDVVHVDFVLKGIYMQNSKKDSNPSNSAVEEEVSCKIPKLKNRTITDYLIKKPITRDFNLKKSRSDALDDISDHFKRSHNNTIEDIDRDQCYQECQSLQKKVTSLPQNSSNFPGSKIESCGNERTKNQAKPTVFLDTCSFQTTVEDNLKKYNIQSSSKEIEKCLSNFQEKMTEPLQLGQYDKIQVVNNSGGDIKLVPKKSQTLSLQKFISNPFVIDNVQPNSITQPSEFILNNRIEERIATTLNADLCRNHSPQITDLKSIKETEARYVPSYVLKCRTDPEESKLNHNLTLANEPLNLCCKDNEILDLSKKNEIGSYHLIAPLNGDCAKSSFNNNTNIVQSEHQPLALVKKTDNQEKSNMSIITRTQTDRTSADGISNCAERKEIEMTYLTTTSSDQLKIIERCSISAAISEPVKIQGQYHLQSHQMTADSKEFLFNVRECNKSPQSDYGKLQELSSLEEYSDYFDDDFNYEVPMKKVLKVEEKEKENLSKHHITEKRCRKNVSEYKNQMGFNDCDYLKSVENISCDKGFYSKIQTRTYLNKDQNKYDCFNHSSNFLNKSYARRKPDTNDDSIFWEVGSDSAKENNQTPAKNIQFRAPKQISDSSSNLDKWEYGASSNRITNNFLPLQSNKCKKQREILLELENDSNHSFNKFFQDGLPMKPNNIFTPLKKGSFYEPFFTKSVTDVVRGNVQKAQTGLELKKIYESGLIFNSNDSRPKDNSDIVKLNPEKDERNNTRSELNSVMKDLSKDGEVTKRTEGNLYPIDETGQFKFGMFSDTISVSEIASAFRKKPQSEKISDILRLLCDKKLSKELAEFKIPDNMYQFVIDDYSTDTSILTSTAKDFLAENKVDKKFVYCKNYTLDGKPTAGQIARLPDINIPSQHSSKEFSNILLNNSMAAPSLFIDEKRRNPYRLIIPRRQKSFLIRKLEFQNGATMNENVRANTLSKSLNRKFKSNSTCDEESFSKEHTPLTRADKKRSICSENYYKDDDVHLDALSNWSPRTEKPTFGVAYSDPVLKDHSLDYCTPIKCSPQIDDSFDFASVLSQNLSEVDSIFSNKRSDPEMYSDWEI